MGVSRPVPGAAVFSTPPSRLSWTPLAPGFAVPGSPPPGSPRRRPEGTSVFEPLPSPSGVMADVPPATLTDPCHPGPLPPAPAAPLPPPARYLARRGQRCGERCRRRRSRCDTRRARRRGGCGSCRGLIVDVPARARAESPRIRYVATSRLRAAAPRIASLMRTTKNNEQGSGQSQPSKHASTLDTNKAGWSTGISTLWCLMTPPPRSRTSNMQLWNTSSTRTKTPLRGSATLPFDVP